MGITTKKNAGVLIVAPGERLDSQSAPEADDAIAGAIAQGESRLLVDFAGTAYVSSAGLRVLLKATKQLKQVNGAFGLCNANEQIAEVLKISGFSTIIDCYPSLDEALRAVGA